MTQIIIHTLTLLAALHHIRAIPVLEQVIPKDNFQRYGLALEAIFGMGIRLQVLLNTSSTDNFVVSPLSTTAIIGQLMLGAEGEFRDDLYELLSLPKPERFSYSVSHYNKDKRNETYSLPYAGFHLQLSSLMKALQKRQTGELYTLDLNNALFYNENIELRSQFKRCLEDIYNAEIRPIDFYGDSASIINEWASNHTHGLIKTILTSQPTPSTASVFLNSIYFLAEWKTPFSDMLNTDDKFYLNENKTVNVTYMLGMLQQVPYAQAKDFRMVCLPYKNNELGMYILFPNQESEDIYNIKNFAESLDPREVIATISSLKPKDVAVKIPKLSLSNTLRVLEPLQKYAEFTKVANDTNKEGNTNTNAIEEIVDQINDFRNFTPRVHRDILLAGAANNVNFKVSDIVQQMVFSINEMGTEAAAVTSGIIDYMGGSKTLVLNRPFSFFIIHEATQAAIFWGTISDPSKN